MAHFSLYSGTCGSVDILHRKLQRQWSHTCATFNYTLVLDMSMESATVLFLKVKMYGIIVMCKKIERKTKWLADDKNNDVMEKTDQTSIAQIGGKNQQNMLQMWKWYALNKLAIFYFPPRELWFAKLSSFFLLVFISYGSLRTASVVLSTNFPLFFFSSAKTISLMKRNLFNFGRAQSIPSYVWCHVLICA